MTKNNQADEAVTSDRDVTIEEEPLKARYLAGQLTINSQHCGRGNTYEEYQHYTKAASRTVILNGQKFRPFAPFQQSLSAYKTLTSRQVIVLWAILLGYGSLLLIDPIRAITLTIGLLTFLYLGSLLASFIISLVAFSQPEETQIDDTNIDTPAGISWPRYTILCPLYHETEVVPQFVQAMLALDYPTDKLQVLCLTEEEDVETRAAIEARGLPSHFSIVTVPAGQPRTKPRACNFGLLQATGEYVVIYDAEDIPEPLQLKKAVLAFANHGPDLACVQAKLNYYNANQNLLTRLFTAEYSLWFDLVLPGMQMMKLPLPLGGTSNHFRAEMLRKVGAWDPFNVTEDCDLGLRLAYYDLKTAILNSTTYEEANSQFKNWIRQRSRWIKGYLQTYLVYMRQPLRYVRQGRLREFFTLQLVIGGKTLVMLVNPLMWLLVALYFPLRPILGAVYKESFPNPVLYMGATCLIAGNFFYLYTLLIGCMKRGQYGLIKWSLLAPIYWAMMSMAAFKALYQLLLKPHYWEKTIHGLHLHSSYLAAEYSSVQEKSIQPSAENQNPLEKLLRGTRTFQRIETESRETAPLPALQSTRLLSRHRSERPAARLRIKDSWLLATIVIACIASIASCWYYFQHHDILLYEDAFSHLSIARRIISSPTPGLAQLGGVWLPLPHLLMQPFIWNDFLWHTGLAGSFSSMFCYTVAVIYLFLAARRLTQDSRASFVGTLLFILNPNVLYIQSTPLSEMACIATTVMTCYYFLAWTQDDHPRYLVGMAASCFLATLSRYDGWGLFLVGLVLLALVGWIKYRHWAPIEGTLLVFGSLGSLGIGLWVLWCTLIFGDPLYFHDFLFSGAVGTPYYTYHNLWQSINIYLLLSIKTVGLIPFVLAGLAIVVFVIRLRLTPTMFGGVIFLTPFVFYIITLFTGQDTIYLPGVGPATTSYNMWNVRFGVEAVAPIALFIAILAKHWPLMKLAGHWPLTKLAPLLTPIRQIALVIAIGIQTLLISSGGIISLQDGLYGDSCAPPHQINAYLWQHYAGGLILENIFYSGIDGAEANVDSKNFISESSGELWKEALNDPSMADWIIVRPGLKIDPIVTHIDPNSPTFLSQFSLVVQEPDGINLYHRNGLPPLPTRPLPPDFLTIHALCNKNGSG